MTNVIEIAEPKRLAEESPGTAPHLHFDRIARVWWSHEHERVQIRVPIQRDAERRPA